MTPPTLKQCRTIGPEDLLGLYQLPEPVRYVAVYEHPDSEFVTVCGGGMCETMNPAEFGDWCDRAGAQRQNIPGRERKLLDTALQRGADELVQKAVRRIAQLRGHSPQPYYEPAPHIDELTDMPDYGQEPTFSPDPDDDEVPITDDGHLRNALAETRAALRDCVSCMEQVGENQLPEDPTLRFLWTPNIDRARSILEEDPIGDVGER